MDKKIIEDIEIQRRLGENWIQLTYDKPLGEEPPDFGIISDLVEFYSLKDWERELELERKSENGNQR